MKIVLGLSILTTTSFLCATPLFAYITELNVVAPKHKFPSVERSYPSMDEIHSRIGVPRSVAQLQKIKIGTSRGQVKDVIGAPVSSYADGSWNFNISLDFPQAHRLICQYRVWFDDNDQVSGTAWRRPQCARIIRKGHGN